MIPSSHAAMDKHRKRYVSHVLAASRLSRGHLLVMAVAAATTIACAALVAA
ncbi:MAG TPA: hypothetical protein VN929_03300 [Burkholderiales bacterium]|nr:hypothetical protein [Burkholderiales bacterium]